jgi:ABC-type Zn uptake system ZnuABC Zn-binding protein ZnuA
MDSLQSTTGADVEAGKTYLSVMEENLSTLTDALK